MYYAPGATHAPHHVPLEWADKYSGQFDDGWDALRDRIFAEQKRRGVVPEDAVLTEQCNQYASCQLLSAYLGHKAVFNAEYHRRPRQFCAADLALGINGAQFNVNLTGVRKPCA